MTKFKDALDYIFIANNSGNSTYLITSTSHNDRATTPAINTNTHNGNNHAYNAISHMGGGGGGNFMAANHHQSRMTSAISASAATVATTTATTAAAIVGSIGIGLSDRSSSSSSATISASATHALTALATMASDSTGNDQQQLYNGVAVGLGAMLINDTLLVDANGTSLFDDFVNGSDLMANATMATGNATATGDEDIGELLRMAATSIVLGLMILITIIGNVFVIAAIILERNLQNVANYLVASLAVADLFVACLVMPLGAVYEISQGWILGPELCDIWTSCDVLCCTASILHLVAIAVDRYWAVTNIDYIHSRTSRRVFLMIFCVWTAAVIVSLAPQFGWKDPDYLQRIEQQKCMVSQDVAYQVFATCCTFYVPLLVILVLYWKIYQTARKRIHRRRPRPIDVTGNNNQPDLTAQKKRKRLRLRIGKFSAQHTKAGTTLGLVEGNSTNTVNTVEDTEFSSSNVDSKSRAGIEATTVFSTTEENPTTSASQISTVSHLVALANQQHAASKSTAPHHHHQKDAQATAQSSKAALAAADDHSTATTAAPTTATKVCIVAPNDSSSNGITSNPHPSGSNAPAATPPAANGGTEVLEDAQLQQQLQQVQQQADADNTTAIPKAGASGATSASNATTITSISALSPQTPTTTLPSAGTQQQHPHAHIAHPLAGSGNASCQVTPLPKPKNQQQLSSIANPMHKVTKRKETLEAKRERKAAKTLAIITGAFVVCWLPFFVMALMLPLCESCQISDGVESLFLWLGYFNSTLNPVIYTIFSPEFRQAFKRILFGGHRPMHYRSGKI